MGFLDNVATSRFARPDKILEPLYIITPVFNPQRFRTRWKLYETFAKQMTDAGAILYVIEASLGDREAVVVEKVDDNHVIIHVTVTHLSEIWIKENLINLAISRLPEDWKYVAVIDADVQFVRPDIVGETLHQLQHYHIVQMFKVAMDVDSKFNTYTMNYGYVYDISIGLVPGADNAKAIANSNTFHAGGSQKAGVHTSAGGELIYTKSLPVSRLHTGFAWAYRKEAIVNLGGLMEYCILGSADNHMSKAFFGYVETTLNKNLSEEYKNMCRQWQQRADKYIQGNVGYVDGTLYHYFHGAKRYRKYKERWQILVDNQYTPSTDIIKDWNGVIRLADNKPKLRDDIRNYFRTRNEDSIDL